MREPLPAHPVLNEYYEDAQARLGFVRGLFDRTARHYNRINRLLSFGSGAWYRGHALRRAGMEPGVRVLDLATGTGLVARAAKRIGARTVVGVDASRGMLAEARTLGTPLVCSLIERLPMADASFDFISIGYALRHIADLTAAFSECRRVLRPGGTIFILEMTRPSSRVGRTFARFYFGRWIPFMSRLATGDKDSRLLMRYFWDTIVACVPPESVLAALGEAGFEGPHLYRSMGVLSEYTARKGAG